MQQRRGDRVAVKQGVGGLAVGALDNAEILEAQQ